MSSTPQMTDVNYRGMVEQIVANGGKVFLFAGTTVKALPVIL